MTVHVYVRNKSIRKKHSVVIVFFKQVRICFWLEKKFKISYAAILISPLSHQQDVIYIIVLILSERIALYFSHVL